MASGMQFRVLGTVEAAVDGSVRAVRGPKRTALLALLLLEAPRPVSVTRLVDELWGDSPPPSAVSALHVHVAALRKVIPGRVLTLPGAYSLRLAAGELDAERFTTLAAEGHSVMPSDPARASALLGEALSLWHGDALAQVARTPTVAAAAARLEETRLAALEDHAEAELALGRHHDLIAELTAAVRAHPMRERLVAALMLSLHRAGRTGDALLAYERLCAELDRELGVDPSDELEALHKAIRRGDPALVPASPGRPDRPRGWSVRPGALVAPTMPTGRFLGRPRLLRRLADRFERRAVVLVAGAGFGKTTLLVQAYNENALHPRGIDLWLSCRPTYEAASVLGAALRALVWAPDAFDAGISETVRTLADIVWEQAPVEVSLILDDVHRIPAHSSGAQLLAELLDALPVNGHLVLASRTPPPLPLARVAALGQVVWIEEEDLRFSNAELAEFAELRSVPAGALEASRGWPALAELAAMTRPASTARRSLIEGYLWQEVLGALAPSRRRDLGMVAGLGELDPELAAAATGHAVDLDELVAGLPLVTGRDGRYRMHALLEQALAGHLAPDDRAASRARAASLLLGRGDLVEAMRLAAGPGHWPGMQAVIRAAAGGGRAPIPPEVLDSWLGRVPPAHGEEPEALLLAAMASADRMPRRAHERFELAMQGFRAAGDVEGELAAMTQWYILAWVEGRHETTALLVARTLELAGRGVRQADVQAAQGRAMAASMTGNWPGVLAALADVGHGRLARELVATTHYLRTLAHIGGGDIPGATLIAERALALGKHRHRILALEAMCFVRILGGDLRSAAAGLPEHGEEAYRIGWPNRIVLYHALAAMLEAEKASLDVAREHLARAAAFEPDQLSRLAQTWLAFARGQYTLQAGDAELAASLLRAELADRPIGSPLTHNLHMVNLARLYVLVPECREAFDAMDLPPFWVSGRSMARALVALWERDDLGPAARLHRIRPEQARLMLPTRWASELALAASAAPVEAQRTLEELGPAHVGWIQPLASAPLPALADRARRVLARIPPVPPYEVEIRFVGPADLLRAGRRVDDPDWREGPHVRALLAYLVVHGGGDRDELAAALWPELDLAAARRSLRHALACLHRVLEPGRGPRQPAFFVRSEAGHVRLEASAQLTVDAWVVQRRLDEAESAGSPAGALAAYEAALALWRGAYLEDVPAGGWAVAARDGLQRRLVAAAVRAGELFLARDGAAQALDLAARALAVDPYCEPAFRLQAAAHLARGDREAMVAALHRCRQALDDLGMNPAPETEMLERAGAVRGS